MKTLPISLMAAVAMALSPITFADRTGPAFAGQAQPLLRLDNGLTVQGDEVATIDGITSGFRLTAGFSPPGLTRLDLGAEISYRHSSDVPTPEEASQLLDTTSIGGSLVAGVRLGQFGLYAKSGMAEWQGDPVTGGDLNRPRGGTARVNGFGARWERQRMISQLEFETFDDPTLSHLNLITASVHFPL